ncbi:hypothetical protein V1511DRAFT_492326 [Dipodascopsis uninucleata]
MSSLRRLFNRTFSGGNLEVTRFAFYLLFPIGFMLYFGVGLEEDIEKQFEARAQRQEEINKTIPKTEEEWNRLFALARLRESAARQRMLQKFGNDSEESNATSSGESSQSN